MAVALSAAAQGTIDFRNRVTASGVNAPIFDVGGGALTSANIVAELYWSATPTGTFVVSKAADNVTAATAAAVANSGPAAGYKQGPKEDAAYIE